MFDSRKSRLLRRALALYAGDHVLSRLEREGERFLSPSIEPVVLTMVFFRAYFIKSDASVTVETMFQWQRAYAEAITRAFFENRGVFDTFVGDDGSGWWDSKDQPDHADRAVECGLAIVRAVRALSERSSSFPTTGLKVGIHTGRVGLGNYGSTIRLRYCPLGDAVNFASRLSWAAPYSGSSIIASRETFEQLRNKEKLSYLGDLTKLGEEPIPAYGVVSEGGHAI